MVQLTRRLAFVAVLACSACMAAQQQVAGREAAAQAGEEGTYIDPWGTPVSWSAVPASASAPGTAAATEAGESKAKEDEVVTPPQPEPETTVTTVNLSGDDDDDD